MLGVKWVTEEDRQAGLAAFLTAAGLRLSLVDCVGFETTRSLGIQVAFALDRHFSEQSFVPVSPQG
jgi:predicted nucleic acid-binding protein